MSNSPVSSYFQLSEPNDSFQPGEDGQLIDLDEVFEATDQGTKTAMVQGMEAMTLGKFSREYAVKMGLKDPHRFDPFPSQRNSVIGAEGFFSTIYDGLKGFIEDIIKYIRMALNWVANTVKGIFGFRKSERIEKAIDESLDSLRQEFKTVLTGLGFPGHEYDLETFIGKLPNAVDRVGQLTLMRSKFETDKEAIKGLSDSLPLLQQCVAKLTDSSNKAVKACDVFKKVIRDEYNRTRVRAAKGEHVEGIDSPEVNRVVVAANEVLRLLDATEIGNQVTGLLSALYKLEFDNEALTDGFNKVRKQLDETIVTQAVKLTQVDLGDTLATIQALNARYVQISDNQIDMSGINLRALGEAIDKTDVEKVKALAEYYGVPHPVQYYQAVSLGLRNYTNFCQMVSRQLLVVHRQINNLSRWYARAHMWYLHSLLEDLETLRKLNLEARADGHKPYANPEGYVFADSMEMIPEADAKTFMEKFGGTSRQMFDENIGGLKTKYNNFVKQTGIGKPL